jgi:hypothetical protein
MSFGLAFARKRFQDFFFAIWIDCRYEFRAAFISAWLVGEGECLWERLQWWKMRLFSDRSGDHHFFDQQEGLRVVVCEERVEVINL